MFAQQLQKNGINVSPVSLQFQSHTLSSILNTNQTTLEQTCLHRIKEQRQKIQDLVSLTQSQQSQLEEKQQTIFQLRQKIEAISTDLSFRQTYEDLKGEFEALTQTYHLEKATNQEKEAQIKRKLTNLSLDLNETKKSEKHLKEQIQRLEIHWRGIVEDKNETLALVERQYVMKEQMLKEKIRNLTQKYKDLKSIEFQTSTQFKEISQQLRSKSRTKERQLQKLKKILEISQQQCSQYRLRISEKENQMELEREQMKEDLQNLNLVVSSLRKEVTQKILEIESLKDNLRKVQLRNRQLEDVVQNINFKEKNSRIKHSLSEQKLNREKSSRIKLQDQFSRIKRQNIKHVEDYNVLQIQLHKWKNIAEKRQESQKMRNILSNSLFR